MKSRIFGAFILLVVLILSLLCGYEVFSVVALVAALLGYRELFNIKFKERENNIETVKFLGYVSLILITLNNVFYVIEDRVTMIIPILCLTIPIVFYNDSKANLNVRK